jgi:hypothetical protein
MLSQCFLPPTPVGKAYSKATCHEPSHKIKPVK